MDTSDHLEHLEHLDKHLAEELAQVARETVRDELHKQTRKQRRSAVLYAASGAAALYAGGAVTVAVGLALAIGLPDWAAALTTGAVLGVASYLLRGAVHRKRNRSSHSDRVIGGTAPAAPPSGLGVPYPPIPAEPPGAPRRRA
ncbi:hypothetical protein GQF42_43270 [Streptomyces broussonetiae]|uniref:Phage holin family protein n=1 Tax=Streptomyces broussonetiae TaxID=2686304 RepID=A0A6I6N7E9_9ACTN|nr:phage holin family protein [Streptomyces broussonetiae]QHA09128.1 hypothetical protein GQF42_43270 [Streptomyces broussonetiae]